MSEEKDTMPESNGEGNKDEDTNDKESVTGDTNAEEANEEENVVKEPVDVEAEIIRQVEYYFGDVNLPRDKFLRDQIGLDDGWVPMEILCRFNRLSRLSRDFDVIENALKKSTSGLLEVGHHKVRRNPEQPLPEMNEDRRKDILARTVYAKGFPKEATLDEILRFFKNYDEVENVIMRRFLDPRTKARLFKGSIFATFKTKEQADKFMEQRDSVKYKDCDLLVLWQDNYIEQKVSERRDKMKKKENKMKKKEEERLAEISLPPGTVVSFEDGHDKMTREEIKNAVTNIDKNIDVAFIDYKIGLTNGWIRFGKENDAVEFVKLLDGGNMLIGDHKVKVKAVEGDEEKKYLERTIQEMTKRRSNLRFRNKGKSHQYKGGKHLKRRMDNNSEDAPAAKVKCDS